jgi:transcriptional regulator with XRE-family HTH domain
MAVKRREPATVGDAIKLARGLRGWTQTVLARKAGLSPASVSAYERDAKAPTSRSLKRIAAAVGFSETDVAAAAALLRRFRDGGQESFVPAQRLPGEWTLAELGSRLASILTDEEAGMAVQSLAAVADDPAWQMAAALWQRLSTEPADAVTELLRRDTAFHDAHLCALLCEKSIEATGRSAARALEIAQWSLIVAERAFHDGPCQERCCGYACAHLANALRVGGELRRADVSLARALGLWRQGLGAAAVDFLNASRVLAIEGSLRRDQRRLPEAHALLDEALSIDRWGQTASLLIGKAKVVEEMGRYEKALTLLSRASFHLDPAAPPEQLFFIRKNTAVILCHLGRYPEALRLLPEIAAMVQSLDIEGLELLRVRWLTARVAAGTGRAAEAIATLDSVRSEFAALGIAYDAALATLELAEVHARLGDAGTVKALAKESMPIFDEQGVHREARRALAIFCRAAEQDAATSELLRRLVGYLYRARQDPKLRFGVAG